MSDNLKSKYIDILHLYFSGYTDGMPPAVLEKTVPKSLLKRYFFIVRHFLNLFFQLPKDLLSYLKKQKVTNNDIWFYVVSKNNYDALKPLERLNEHGYSTKFITVGKQLNIHNAPYIENFPLYFKFIHFLKYFPIYAHFKKHYPAKAKRQNNLIFIATGSYEACRLLLRKEKPKAIIFANDINTVSRSLLWAAKSRGIPTIYLQHASVSKYFPKLAFDLNLLEGQDAYEKYKDVGDISGRTELIGCAKFDSYILQENTSPVIRHIGVCSNEIDSKVKVEKVITFLSQSYPEMVITYRPHPREEGSLKLAGRINVSNSKTEDVTAFLRKQDLIIADNSNILLEAAMLNISALKYNFSNGAPSDYYGFVANGLVDEAVDLTELRSYLDKYHNNRPRYKAKAKRYNDVIATDREGNSAHYAIDIIKKFLN